MDLDFTFYSTLTSSDFRWLLKEAWEPEDLSFFTAHRSKTPYQNFRTPPPPIEGKEVPNKIEARWLLKPNDQEDPIAWAECQRTTNKFSIANLFIGNPNQESLATMLGEEVLSHLISSIFITSTPDELVLSFDNIADRENLKSLNWAREESIWLANSFPNLMFSDSPGMEFEQYRIDPIEWFKTEQGIKDQETLNYLALRKERLVAKEQKYDPTTRPTSGGILSKLFGRR